MVQRCPVSSALFSEKPAPVAGAAQRPRYRHVQVRRLQGPAPLCRAALAPDMPLEPAIEDIPLADSEDFWLAPGPHTPPPARDTRDPLPAPCLRHERSHAPAPTVQRPEHRAARLGCASKECTCVLAGELSHINRLDFRTKPADVFRCFGCTEAECQVPASVQLPCNCCATSAARR